MSFTEPIKSNETDTLLNNAHLKELAVEMKQLDDTQFTYPMKEDKGLLQLKLDPKTEEKGLLQLKLGPKTEEKGLLQPKIEDEVQTTINGDKKIPNDGQCYGTNGLIKDGNMSQESVKDNLKYDEFNSKIEPLRFVNESKETLIEDKDAEKLRFVNDSKETLIEDKDSEKLRFVNDSKETLIEDKDSEKLRFVNDSKETFIEDEDAEKDGNETIQESGSQRKQADLNATAEGESSIQESGSQRKQADLNATAEGESSIQESGSQRKQADLNATAEGESSIQESGSQRKQADLNATAEGESSIQESGSQRKQADLNATAEGESSIQESGSQRKQADLNATAEGESSIQESGSQRKQADLNATAEGESSIQESGSQRKQADLNATAEGESSIQESGSQRKQADLNATAEGESSIQESGSQRKQADLNATAEGESSIQESGSQRKQADSNPTTEGESLKTGADCESEQHSDLLKIESVQEDICDPQFLVDCSQVTNTQNHAECKEDSDHNDALPIGQHDKTPNYDKKSFANRITELKKKGEAIYDKKRSRSVAKIQRETRCKAHQQYPMVYCTHRSDNNYHVKNGRHGGDQIKHDSSIEKTGIDSPTETIENRLVESDTEMDVTEKNATEIDLTVQESDTEMDVTEMDATKIDFTVQDRFSGSIRDNTVVSDDSTESVISLSSTGTVDRSQSQSSDSSSVETPDAKHQAVEKLKHSKDGTNKRKHSSSDEEIEGVKKKDFIDTDLQDWKVEINSDYNGSESDISSRSGSPLDEKFHTDDEHSDKNTVSGSKIVKTRKSKENKNADFVAAQADSKKAVEHQADSEKVFEHQADSEKVVDNQADSEKTVEHLADSEKVVEHQADSEKTVEHLADSEKVVEIEHSVEVTTSAAELINSEKSISTSADTLDILCPKLSKIEVPGSKKVPAVLRLPINKPAQTDDKVKTAYVDLVLPPHSKEHEQKQDKSADSSKTSYTEVKAALKRKLGVDPKTKVMYVSPKVATTSSTPEFMKSSNIQIGKDKQDGTGKSKFCPKFVYLKKTGQFVPVEAFKQRNNASLLQSNPVISRPSNMPVLMQASTTPMSTKMPAVMQALSSPLPVNMPVVMQSSNNPLPLNMPVLMQASNNSNNSVPVDMSAVLQAMNNPFSQNMPADVMQALNIPMPVRMPATMQGYNINKPSPAYQDKPYRPRPINYRIAPPNTALQNSLRAHLLAPKPGHSAPSISYRQMVPMYKVERPGRNVITLYCKPVNINGIKIWQF